MRGHDDARPTSDPATMDDRLRSAMAAFTAPVTGSDDAFERIAARIDDESHGGGSRRSGVMDRSHARVVSIAAAVLVAVLIGATAVALVRGDRGVDVVTQPAGPPSGTAPVAIVAATADGRIVELDLDGRERRTIAGSFATGIAAADYRAPYENPEVHLGPDGSVYFTRLAGPRQSDCFEAKGQVWIGTEIVAVPFAGGEPRVVVPVGASFDISPDGRYLAYAGPGGAQRCLDVGSSSLLSVLDLETGQRTQLANGATIQTGPPHRVRWSADGTEILGTRPPAPAAGFPGAVRVTFPGGIPSAATPPQQLMLLPQSPDLVAENARTDPNGTFVNALGVPERVGPMFKATTVDLVSITSSGGAQELVTVEKVKDGPLLLTLAPFDRSVRGDQVGQVVIPTERIAEVGTAQKPPSEWSLAVDRSGSRMLVTVGQGTGPGLGSDPHATYVVDGDTVRLLATNFVAATWVESEIASTALPSNTPTTTATPTMPTSSIVSTGSAPASAPGTTPPPSMPDGESGGAEPSLCPTSSGRPADFQEPAFVATLPEPTRRRYRSVVERAVRCDLFGGRAYRFDINTEVLALLSAPPVDESGAFRWGPPFDPDAGGADDLGIVLTADGASELWRLPCDTSPDPQFSPEGTDEQFSGTMVYRSAQCPPPEG